MLNNICLVGRLVADPQYTATNSGTSVARFTLAVQRDFADKSGNKETDFIPCIAWKQTAEFITRHFTKGGMMCVSGRLTINKYEKDGQKRSSTEVVVDNAYFYGEKSRDAAPAAAPVPNRYEPETPGGYAVLADDDSEMPF